MILGTGILLFVKLPFVRRQVKYLGTYSLVVGFLIILLYTVPGILDSFVKILGRDNTLTGRTDLWADVLGEPINRLLGTGYQDFWLGARADYFWDKYAFHPIQAHNGYLETYLNGGLLGLFLLLAMLIYTGSKLKRELLLENSFGILLFAVFVSAVFYNWTEAMFSRLHLFWFLLIITALYHRPSYESVPEEMAPAVQGDP
jgi:O-antigen ligase